MAEGPNNLSELPFARLAGVRPQVTRDRRRDASDGCAGRKHPERRKPLREMKLGHRAVTGRLEVSRPDPCGKRPFAPCEEPVDHRTRGSPGLLQPPGRGEIVDHTPVLTLGSSCDVDDRTKRSQGQEVPGVCDEHQGLLARRQGLNTVDVERRRNRRVEDLVVSRRCQLSGPLETAVDLDGHAGPRPLDRMEMVIG